jgi:hypothetical protein
VPSEDQEMNEIHLAFIAFQISQFCRSKTTKREWTHWIYNNTVNFTSNEYFSDHKSIEKHAYYNLQDNYKYKVLSIFYYKEVGQIRVLVKSILYSSDMW